MVDWIELRQTVSDTLSQAWVGFGHLPPLYILLTIGAACLATYILSRTKETFVLALTAAIYAVPFLLS